MTKEVDRDSQAISGLVRLCHHGWVIPLVVELGRERGARFVVLQNRLGVARTTLERALSAALDQDLVMRNPGYGHPLRPEYLLTPWGERLGLACEAVHEATKGITISAAVRPSDLVRRKWSLPVLASLCSGSSRYSDLQGDLAGCTPRALSVALEHLQVAGWIRRKVIDDRPPGPRYHITPAIAKLAHAAWALAVAAR